jgi:hypothetical protein
MIVTYIIFSISPPDTENVTTHIVSETQHNFRSSVPSGSDILGHESLISRRLGISFSGCVSSCKAKITYFKITVGIDKEIAWLEITM